MSVQKIDNNLGYRETGRATVYGGGLSSFSRPIANSSTGVLYTSNFPHSNSSVAITGASTTVGTDFTSLGEFSVGDANLINLQISNTGATAISDFKIVLKNSATGEEFDYLVDTDFATAGHPNIPFASTSAPDSLAGGADTHLIFKTNGAYSFIPYAKVGSGTTTVVVSGGGSND